MRRAPTEKSERLIRSSSEQQKSEGKSRGALPDANGPEPQGEGGRFATASGMVHQGKAAPVDAQPGPLLQRRSVGIGAYRCGSCRAAASPRSAHQQIGQTPGTADCCNAAAGLSNRRWRSLRAPARRGRRSFPESTTPRAAHVLADSCARRLDGGAGALPTASRVAARPTRRQAPATRRRCWRRDVAQQEADQNPNHPSSRTAARRAPAARPCRIAAPHGCRRSGARADVRARRQDHPPMARGAVPRRPRRAARRLA